MAKAYAYIRYSLAIQGAGDSENRQSSALDAFTKETGLEISEISYDRGKSAFRGDNARTGKLKEIIEKIDSGVIKKGDYLVVESIDRITRQRVLDGVELLQGILKRGVSIYTTSDGKTYSYNDPEKDFENLLMISLIAKRANEESEIKSKRLIAAWGARRERARSGEMIIKSGNSIPYGLRAVNGVFEIHEEERAEVEEVFHLLLAHGLNTAVKKINKTAKKPWCNATLNKLISSRSVIGGLATHTVVYNNGRSRKVQTGIIEGYYPKLISDTLFYQVVSKMQERKHKNWNGNKSTQDFNIFQHQIYCAKCKDKIYYDHRGSRYNGVIYPLFKCNSAKITYEKCDAHNIRFEIVLCMLLDILHDFEKLNSAIHSKQFTDFFRDVAKITEKQESNVKEIDIEVSRFNSKKLQLQNLERSIEGLDFKIPTSVMRKISELESSAAELEKKIKILMAIESKEEVRIDSYKAVIEHFKTEAGRVKLNTFFKENNLQFHVELDKVDRYGTMRIYRENDGVLEIIFEQVRLYPKKNILNKYGLSHLQEMFNLRIPDGRIDKGRSKEK